MFKNKFNLLFAFALFISLINPQEKIFTSYDLFNIKNVSETAVSPDGKKVAFTLNIPRPFTDKPGSDYKNLYVYNFETGQSKVLIEGKVTLSSLGWTPDSDQITFIASIGRSEINQVFSADAKVGSVVRVTNSKTPVKKYHWNPNGSSIAYTAESKIEKREQYDKGFNQEIFEENIPSLDLYIMDFHTRKDTKVNNDGAVFEFYWNNSGDKIAAAIAPRNLVDDSYMFKRLYILDPYEKEMELLINNPGKLGTFAWSPNDEYIAFISAADTNDAVDGSLFIVEADNSDDFKEIRNYSKNFIGSVTDLSWLNNNTVIFSAEEGVNTVLSKQQVDAAEREILIEGGKVIFTTFSHSANLVSFAGDSHIHPDELYTFEISTSELKKRSDFNQWLSNYKLADQTRISYPARDGLMIEGILIYPLNYEEGEEYPLIVYAHGGPESANHNGWVTTYNRWGQVASAKGYFVFMPNYRAGSGRGYEFTLMGFADAGGKEFDDVIDGIDYLIDKGYVDGDRVGIGGGSYGGYFSAWAATRHSDRFAAAVSFVGVSNQLSKRNTTDIPWESYYVHWGMWNNDDPMFVYERSPVKWASNSKTPTLILHGKDDPRVHPSQSLELYRTLKMNGKAPVRLVWYPGEGHGNRKNPARLDYNLRTLAWFNYYLTGDNPTDQMPPAEIEYGVDTGE